MPARNPKNTSVQTNAKENATNKSALFPSGNVDAETKAAYEAMMKAHGDKAVPKKSVRGGPVDMTPKPTPAAFPELPQPKVDLTVEKPDERIMSADEPNGGTVAMSEPVRLDGSKMAVSKNTHNRGKLAEFTKAMSGISASAVYSVRLSDGRELSFESPKVKVQKTLNQILASNQDDPAAQYIAQLSLLKTVCLTDGIDWCSVSDFDRNKIMFSLYRDILFRDEYKYKCDDKDCGFEWMGKLDGDKIIRNLDASDVSDKIVEKKADGVTYRIRVGFPLAKAMIGFLTDFGERKRAKAKAEGEEQIDAATLLEYIDLFVKEIWVSKDGVEGAEAHINLDDMYVAPGMQMVDENGQPMFDDLGEPIVVDPGQCYRDAMDVLGSLPSAILQANSDDDVYTRISKMLIEVVNNALPDCVCPKCGHRMGKAFGFNDFFSRG